VTEEDLAAVVARVDRAEANGEVAAPDTQTDCPTSVIPAGKEPQPGSIVSRCEVQSKCSQARMTLINLDHLAL